MNSSFHLFEVVTYRLAAAIRDELHDTGNMFQTVKHSWPILNRVWPTSRPHTDIYKQRGIGLITSTSFATLASKVNFELDEISHKGYIVRCSVVNTCLRMI